MSFEAVVGNSKADRVIAGLCRHGGRGCIGRSVKVVSGWLDLRSGNCGQRMWRGGIEGTSGGQLRYEMGNGGGKSNLLDSRRLI